LNEQQANGRHGFLGRASSHLDEVELSYFGHLKVALTIGGTMVGAGLACLLHGIFPAIFQTNASRTIKRLNDHIEGRSGAPHHREPHHALEFEI
jgi:hypothetical protein